MKSIFCIKATFLTLCLILPSISYGVSPGSRPLGKITACNGRLNLIRDGQLNPVLTGSNLRLGDRIQSETSDALVEILFYDIGRVTIGKLSSIKIRTLPAFENEASGRIALDLISGTAHFNVGDNEINVRTPAASIRSSKHGEFYVRHKDNETEIFCIEDNTIVRNAKLGWDLLSQCYPGFFIRVSGERVPSAPLRLTDEMLADLADETGTHGAICGNPTTIAAGMKDAHPAGETKPLGFVPRDESGASAVPSAAPPIGQGRGRVNPSESTFN